MKTDTQGERHDVSRDCSNAVKARMLRIHGYPQIPEGSKDSTQNHRGNMTL